MPHYSGRIQSKLPQVGTTIFTVMSRLAAEHDAINLSQGFPDFDCAPELRALVTKYLNAGLNQYPPMAGVACLREAVAEKASALYGCDYDPEHEVTIVPGATYGIYTAMATLVRPGDEVILFEPAYDSYAPAVEVHGGKPVYVQLTYPDYAIDWQAVQRAIRSAHARDRDQHTEQSDGERLFRGGPADAGRLASRNRYRARER